MKQEQQLGTGSIPSSLQIKTFFIDIIYMAPLEIIIRAKLVRHKYEYLVYYVCNKQPNMCSRLNNINKYHLYLSISVWKDYFNTKKRYEDILGRTSESILNANKFTTPW